MSESSLCLRLSASGRQPLFSPFGEKRDYSGPYGRKPGKFAQCKAHRRPKWKTMRLSVRSVIKEKSTTFGRKSKAPGFRFPIPSDGILRPMRPQSFSVPHAPQNHGRFPPPRSPRIQSGVSLAQMRFSRAGLDGAKKFLVGPKKIVARFAGSVYTVIY